MELVLTPVLFAGIGYVLDRVFGTVPILTIAFAVFAVAGMFVRAYFRYEAEMQRHEADAPWRKVAGSSYRARRQERS